MRNGNLLKSHVSEIHLKQIRVNRGVGLQNYSDWLKGNCDVFQLAAKIGGFESCSKINVIKGQTKS